MGLLEQQAARTIQTIEDQLKARDLVPATRTRCRAIIEAVRAQTADILNILGPVVGTALHPIKNEEHPAPLQYIHYLYRDWGWPLDPNGENARALNAVKAVIDESPFGQTLVIGAGACRLAYDLHRLHSDTDTTVLDIDAFLMTTAHRVIRGDSVTLREANAEIDKLAHVAKEWTLHAPHGPLDDERFHFIIANGLDAPCEPASFDTVVTPWFIDLVPRDLRDFMSEVHRLLKPGGRWLNLGPLKYGPDVSIARRFSREEVFDLATRAGLPVDKWNSESVPYLVSKVNGRGKMEQVLAFAATRQGAPDSARKDGAPPDWLIFRHLPIPVFAGQSLFFTQDPAEQIVLGAIDGQRTLDDIASVIAGQAGDSGLTMDQLREVVRRCLVEIHPVCSRTS